MLRCMGEYESSLVLAKVHKGAYNSHIGRKSLAHKLLRVVYYWPTLMKNITAFFKKYNQWQRHVDLYHGPTELF